MSTNDLQRAPRTPRLRDSARGAVRGCPRDCRPGVQAGGARLVSFSLLILTEEQLGLGAEGLQVHGETLAEAPARTRRCPASRASSSVPRLPPKKPSAASASSPLCLCS